METINLILSIVSVSFFATHTSEFIEELNQILKNKRNILKIPGKILMCMKCTSFWVTLIWTQDFLLSTQISLLAFLFDKYILTTPIKL